MLFANYEKYHYVTTQCFASQLCAEIHENKHFTMNLL